MDRSDDGVRRSKIYPIAAIVERATEWTGAPLGRGEIAVTVGGDGIPTRYRQCEGRQRLSTGRSQLLIPFQ
jgi:hypothetical protein